MTSILTTAATCHQALAHSFRLRILAMLADGELCVGELRELLDLAFSTVSQHLQELQAAELVEARKNGRWVFYRLAGSGPSREVLDCVARQLDGDKAIRADRRKAAELRARRGADGCSVPTCQPADDPTSEARNRTAATAEDR